MKKLILILTLSLPGITACNKSTPERIKVATAANMQFAIAELANVYSSKTGNKIDVILGSSGKLSAQIIEGAPFDIFLSADPKYPQMLQDRGKLYFPPETYAFGSLVLWSIRGKASLQELRETGGKIALPNPDLAPYGKAAKEAMIALKIFDEKFPQFVYGESVAQSNQFILSGNAIMGFTSKSVVLAPGQRDKGLWTEVDRSLYTAIEQTAAIIKRGDEVTEEVRAFYNYLFSEEATGILETYGYRRP